VSQIGGVTGQFTGRVLRDSHYLRRRPAPVNRRAVWPGWRSA